MTTVRNDIVMRIGKVQRSPLTWDEYMTLEDATDEIVWLRAERDELRAILLSAMQIVLQRWEPGGSLEGEWMPFSVRELKRRYEEVVRYVRVGDLIVNVNR